jgi:hypothetical protein
LPFKDQEKRKNYHREYMRTYCQTEEHKKRRKEHRETVEYKERHRERCKKYFQEHNQTSHNLRFSQYKSDAKNEILIFQYHLSNLFYFGINLVIIVERTLLVLD